MNAPRESPARVVGPVAVPSTSKDTSSRAADCANGSKRARERKDREKNASHQFAMREECPFQVARKKRESMIASGWRQKSNIPVMTEVSEQQVPHGAQQARIKQNSETECQPYLVEQAFAIEGAVDPAHSAAHELR
jgi:hypothetical protein